MPSALLNLASPARRSSSEARIEVDEALSSSSSFGLPSSAWARSSRCSSPPDSCDTAGQRAPAPRRWRWRARLPARRIGRTAEAPNARRASRSRRNPSRASAQIRRSGARRWRQVAGGWNCRVHGRAHPSTRRSRRRPAGRSPSRRNRLSRVVSPAPLGPKTPDELARTGWPLLTSGEDGGAPPRASVTSIELDRDS